MAADSGVVQIHGKAYMTVAHRIKTFREEHQDWSICTEIISADDERVVIKAVIANPAGQIISTGHAEEVRSASTINRTSALENAETSAVGRALAFYGLAGTEIASADEVANAIKQQNTTEFSSKQMKTKVWKALRDAAAEEDSLKCGETWRELTTEQQLEIWRELSSGQRSTIKKLLDETKEDENGV